MRVLTAVLTFLFAAASAASSQQVRAARVSGAPPRVDGVLDDQAWTHAPPLTQFVQRNPIEGAAASESTEVRFAYTDRALYIGLRAFDRHPERIVGRLVRRDQRVAADNVTIFLDSFFDRRTAFEFNINASGSRRDVLIYDDGGGRDDSWDPVYASATRVDSLGWTAEWMIPFSQLRFARRDSLVFGLRVRRFILRRSEDANWPFFPRDLSGEVSRYGQLVGLHDVPTPRRLELLPYASSRARLVPAEPGNPFVDPQALDGRAGLDAKLGVTSGLTLDATINPDFGQVEADPAVVNLTAFETFFPEKRPFFIEGSNLFRFELGAGDEGLVYTRRIGRPPQVRVSVPGGYANPPEQTTILGAAKLTGQLGSGWALGLAQAVTAKEHAPTVDSLGAPGDLGVEPLTSHSVARVQRTASRGRLSYGVLATSVVRDLDEARFDGLHQSAVTGGADVRWRFGSDRYELQGGLAASRVAGSSGALLRTQRSSARYFQRPDNTHTTLDSARTSLAGFAGLASIAKVTGRVLWSALYQTTSPGFEANDIGFQRTADRHFQAANVQLRWLQPSRRFRSARVSFGESLGLSYGGERTHTVIGAGVELEFLNYWELEGSIERSFDALDTRLLRGGPAFRTPGRWQGDLSLRTDFRRPFWARVGARRSREDASGATRWSLDGTVSWRPAGQLSLSLSGRGQWGIDDRQYITAARPGDSTYYVFATLDRRELSLSLRANLALTPRLSFELFAQPLVSAGGYPSFRLVADPQAARYAARFDPLGPDRLTRRDGDFEVDVGNDGTGDFTFANPNFRVASLRTSAVARWEFRPGSTLFLVWQQDGSRREMPFADPSLDLPGSLLDAVGAESRHTIALKVSYWIGL